MTPRVKPCLLFSFNYTPREMRIFYDSIVDDLSRWMVPKRTGKFAKQTRLEIAKKYYVKFSLKDRINNGSIFCSSHKMHWLLPFDEKEEKEEDDKVMYCWESAFPRILRVHLTARLWLGLPRIASGDAQVDCASLASDVRKFASKLPSILRI